MPGAAEVITWPDAEAAVIAFLEPALAALDWDGVAVSTKQREGPHVQVLRTGGPIRALVWDDAQITIDCRAPESTVASALARDCRALLLAAGREGDLGGIHIGEVDAFGGPQNNPDPTTSAARYSATYTVPFRGTTDRSS